MTSKNNIIFLIRGIAMFLLCAINIYVMELEVINIIFGVLPFFIIGIFQIYNYFNFKGK